MSMIKYRHVLPIACLIISGCALKPVNSTVQAPSEPAAEASVEKENARPLEMSPLEVQKRLSLIAAKASREIKVSSRGPEFSVSLPVKMTEGDQKSEWHASYVTVFHKNLEKVDQISIVTMTCKAQVDEFHKDEIQQRIKQLVKLVSEKSFGSSFDFKGEGYFKELGPYWDRGSQVVIRETQPLSQKMRLSRGVYKCDGHSGFGFRYDFIMKRSE